MDAVWSSAIIVMAFAASTAAFNSSTRTAARDSMKTQAFAVAQSQMEWMRAKADLDQNYVMNSVNNTTVTVPYRGTNYTVTRIAVPSSGEGEGGSVSACSVDRADAQESESLPESTPYIYMRVVVTWPGQVVTNPGPTGGVGFNATEPVALDSNYAAEGGTADLTTGMLRVYLLNPQGDPATGVSGVTLKFGGTTIQPSVPPNETNGCYLFAGLTAGSYTIQVATTKQDVYLGNPSNLLTRDYTMPTGALRSTDITIAAPVSVSPIYRAFTNAAKTTSQQVDPKAGNGANNVNDFVKSPYNNGQGYWVGQSDEVIEPPDAGYFTGLPGNGAFFPTGYRTATDKSLVYPTKLGYAAYAGPCRVNYPGAAGLVTVPGNLADFNWNNGGTLSTRPELWLSELRPNAVMTPIYTSQPSNPDTGWGSTQTYYWSQTVADTQVQVALVGDSAGSAAPTQCNNGFSLGSTQPVQWKRIPGSVSGSGALLDNIASALPPGSYDICIRTKVNFTQRDYYGGSIFFGVGAKWNGSATAGSQVGYMKGARASIGFKSAPVNPATNFSPPDWKKIMSTSASTSSATCGDSTKWTG